MTREQEPTQDAAPAETETDQQQAEVTESWAPILMAGAVLLGIGFFIFCGVSTWWLFQKRGELAVRTLEQTFVPEVEQSMIAPEDKAKIVKRLTAFAADIKRGKVENWQAGGVMQRLVRLPILQWGELAVLEDFLQNQGTDTALDSAMQISRFRRAVELDKATAVDAEDILNPVVVADDSVLGRRLVDKLTLEDVSEVAKRAKLVADRSDVPAKQFGDISLDDLVRRQVESGMQKGAM